MTATPGAVTAAKFVMSERQRLMWPVLVLGAFFEGFDDTLINVALPYISRDFHLTTQGSSYLLSLIAVGTMVAFFASRLADRFGRRRVFLWCVYLYSACSLLTALSFWLPLFAAMQFVARLFLIGCWSTGYVIVCEEFGTGHRGLAVGRFQLTAVLGGLLIGLLLSVVMHLGLGWRALYVVGALPAIPALIMNHRLPETGTFTKLQVDTQAGVAPKQQNFLAAWGAPHTRNLVALSLVWIFMYFGIKGSLNFFALRAVNELSWTPNQISIGVLTSTISGIFIIAVSGKLLDILGRRNAAVLIVLLGVVFSVATYSVTSFVFILIFNMISVGCLNSFLIVGSTLTNEMFPTQIRANAMAWSNNIIGRLGQILVPVVIGSLSAMMTLGHSIALTMLLPLISLGLIVFALPAKPPYADQVSVADPEPALEPATVPA